jgi:hypothetical protein
VSDETTWQDHADFWQKRAVKAEEEVERLRAWQREMVEIAASGGRLDGYRELGAKLAARDAEIDKLRGEVTHWRKARRDCLEAGDMLKKQNDELWADANRYRLLRNDTSPYGWQARNKLTAEQIDTLLDAACIEEALKGEKK